MERSREGRERIDRCHCIVDEARVQQKSKKGKISDTTTANGQGVVDH